MVCGPCSVSFCGQVPDANLIGFFPSIAQGNFLLKALIRPLGANLVGLYRVITHRLYTSHHLFLGDQVVDPL